MGLLEAFSAGLPCVTSAIDGCLEAMRIEGAGPSAMGLAVANDADAVASALSTLAGQPSERVIMGRAAREAWEKKYSSAAMCDGYLELYNKLLGKREPGIEDMARQRARPRA
jgi:glycosyltransferase involved in cell wall biosynthesis